MKTVKIIALAAFLLLPGCWWLYNNDYDFEFDTIITDYPANLDGINSEFDDYNSHLPYNFEDKTIYFSSNRKTSGVSYDIEHKYLEITSHPHKDDILNISYKETDTGTEYDRKVCLLANTASDEYGPYTYSPSYGYHYFFYANNETGNLDIRLIYNLSADWDYNGSKKLYGPVDVKVLNTPFDDAYPSVSDSGDRIYFCSNRDNNRFDIYSASLETGIPLHDYLNTAILNVQKETVLSGEGNDKCPYINKNLLVFTSDRDGGFGGYDLYYSRFKDGQWSAPVNFGNKINTEYDEYRPVTIDVAWLSRRDEIMIFSSNRPEGKGGYDLYCVNIGDLIDNPW